MTPWTPPTELQVITAPIYAFLRMGIEAGNLAITSYKKARSEGCKSTADGGTGCWLEPEPTVATIAEIYYRYVPWSAISMAPAQAFANEYYPGDEARYPNEEDASVRIGWPTFVDRKALVSALDDVTPAAVRAQVGSLDRPPDLSGNVKDLPGANTDDPSLNLQWWLKALGAGGALAWLGKSKALAALLVLSPGSKVKALIAIAAGFVLFAGATGAAAAVLPWLQKEAELVVFEPLSKGTNILAIAAGIAGATILGFVVYKYIIENKPTKREPREIAA